MRKLLTSAAIISILFAGMPEPTIAKIRPSELRPDYYNMFWKAVTTPIGFFNRKTAAVPTLTFLQGTLDSTSSTTYSYTSQSLGTAAADRYIVCFTGGRASSSRSSVTCTIAGVSATAVTPFQSNGSGFTHARMFIAAVPTGTSGTVSCTWSGTMNRAGIIMWRLTGINPTAVDTTTSLLDDPTGTCTLTANNVVIAAAYNATTSSNTATWTGLTENFDSMFSGNQSMTGASQLFTAAGNQTASIAYSISTDVCFAMACWGP